MEAPIEVCLTVTSAVAFAALFKLSPLLSSGITQYKKLYIGDRRDWDSRVGSTVHAVLVTVMALYYFCFTDTFTDDPSTGRLGSMATTSGTTAVLAMSLGYFLVDFFLVLYYYPALGAGAMIGHHATSIACLLTMLVNDKAHAYGLAGLVTEITTPSMNLFHWCRAIGKQSSVIFKINGLLILLLWFVFRIVIAVPGLYYIYQHYYELDELPIYGKALVLLVPIMLLGLNIMWFQKLAAGALKMVRKTLGKGQSPQIRKEKKVA